uniref:Pro-neuregulin-2, membrane-bound isoform n=1 Tax=Corvus moneduloides TaxID=1196302 RepID=A0A8C3ERT5_CORMO
MARWRQRGLPPSPRTPRDAGIPAAAGIPGEGESPGRESPFRGGAGVSIPGAGAAQGASRLLPAPRRASACAGAVPRQAVPVACPAVPLRAGAVPPRAVPCRAVPCRAAPRRAAPLRPAAPAAPQPRSPAPQPGRRRRAGGQRAAAGGMRRDPAPGFSMLLFGVSLACYSPSLKSVQDQAYTAAVVLEGKVQSVGPPAGGNDSRGAGPAGGVLVKVLDLWPLNSGGLQREQLISVGSKAPCFKVKRNHRYIFFLEPTEEPLVFRTAFAPLDTSGKNLKRDVARILCADCAVPPKLKKLKSPNVHVGEKISLKCEATAGNPQPSYKWFKDGKELKKSKDIRIKYGNGKKISRLQFNKVKLEDAGEYSCEAENVLGKDTTKGSLNVKSGTTKAPQVLPASETKIVVMEEELTTTLSSWSGHARKCNETAKSYCVNGGVCYYIEGINQLSCKCPNGFFGQRCLEKLPLRLYMPDPKQSVRSNSQETGVSISQWSASPSILDLN